MAPKIKMVKDRSLSVALAPGSGDSPTGVDSAASTSLRRGGGLIAPALTFVNVIGYALTVIATRTLSKDAYGALNAFLAVLLVASVPALALQAVVARAIARRPQQEVAGPRERALLQRCIVIGLVVSAVVAAAAPLLAAFLHTGPLGPLWIALQLTPLVILSAAMGLLQGKERFRLLALVIAGQALGKAIGIVPLLAHGSSADVLAAITAGTVLSMVGALVAVGRGQPGPVPEDLPALREVLHASTGLFALLVLANLDLLLARHVLPGDESGRYSAGAVLAKAAFWLPQAVAVVVFPRLTDHEGGRPLLRKAVLVVSGLGLIEFLGCLALAGPVLQITFGPSYRSLATLAPLWVVQGTALAIVQLLVYRAIATQDRLTAPLVGGAAVVEVLVLLGAQPSTIFPVVGTATVVAVALAVLLLLRLRVRP